MLLNALTKMKDLLKFGKTFVSLKYRFSSKYELPYKYKVLYTYTFDDGVECSKLELKLRFRLSINIFGIVFMLKNTVFP